MELINDDCFEKFGDIADNSIDAVITDPPYAIDYRNDYEDEEYAWDKKSAEEYEQFTKKWLDEAYRVLKPGGTCWFFYGFTMIEEVFRAVNATQFTKHLENCICMARKRGRGTKTKLKSLREECMMLTKSDDYTWNPAEYLRKVIVPYTVKRDGKRYSRGWTFGPDGKTPVRWSSLGNVCAFHSEPCWVDEDRGNLGNVLDLTSGLPLRFDGEPSDVTFFAEPSYLDQFQKRYHSAQKPIMMMVMLTTLSTREGEKVLDPFMGAGTEGVACRILGRDFIGIEREKGTFETAKHWIENFDRQKARLFVSEHVSTTDVKKVQEIEVPRKRKVSEKPSKLVGFLR
jgi:DNA modification methylase